MFAPESMLSSFNGCGANMNVLPASCDNAAKGKNFILDEVAKDSNISFVHVIDGCVELMKDPNGFITEAEHVMDALDYNIYFSTSVDKCNYVFNKFSPRLTISIDDENIRNKLGLPDKLSFTSHSNTIWTIYDCRNGAGL